ncbi:MAG: ABC transporter substrate-binding protein [Nitrososphaerota archaeon]|nr:ABC transporter substrate-binding protein [Candidatus Calditenuis fumarioli]
MKAAEKGLGISTAAAAGLAVVLLVVGLAIGAFAIGPAVSPARVETVRVTERVTVTAAGLPSEVTIGALLPLTGDLASYGENSRAALELALSEINDYLKRIGAGFTIKLVIEDTETKPETADAKLKSLHARGITLIVGPQTSGEVRRIKGYADSNKILLVSQSSTAPDLAIPDDFVLRFCPDDTIQGPIGPRLAKELGATHIIYVWRGDAWGDGLYRTSSDEAKKLGLTIAGEIRYAPEKKEFSAEAATLADTVKKLINQGVDPKKIFIEYVAFGEAVAFMSAAADYPELAQVRWFGSDGTAQLAEVLQDPKISAFVANVKWVNPLFAPAENEKKQKVMNYVKQKLGREPDAYAYAAYDILWVYALTILQVQKVDADLIRKAMPEVARSYYGAIGRVVLNAAGDLAGADYDLWVVQKAGDKYQWVKAGVYSFTTGAFSWTPGFSL